MRLLPAALAIVSSEPTRNSMRSATPFSRAFSRAISIASASVSQAAIRADGNSFAAAIARSRCPCRHPENYPPLKKRMIAFRQRRVVSCVPVPKAIPGSMRITMRLASVAKFTPRRRNNQPANFHWQPILFPFAQPVLIGKLANVHLANRRRRQVINAKAFANSARTNSRSGSCSNEAVRRACRRPLSRRF